MAPGVAPPSTSIVTCTSRAPEDCAVYRRELIPPGVTLNGPCVIEEYGSTTVLFAGDSLSVAKTGEMIIKVGQQ